MSNNTLDLGENDLLLENKYLDNSIDKQQYNLPWIEKYRPDNFEDIISHNDILNALDKMINNNSLPHLIFYGPPGTGKTTTILASAKKMYGNSYRNMILELNGSEDRGINVVREQIKDFSASKQFINNSVKLVILDEADSMTYDAQFALRRVIENYTSNTRFCLICNYETKIITALKSRCMIFRFSPISSDVHFNKLKNIANKEQVNIQEESLKLLIKLAEGDMRKSINLIQSIHTALKYYNMEITVDDIYRQIGYPTIKQRDEMIKIIFDKKVNLKDTIKKINHFKHLYGISSNDILKDITNYIITFDNNINMFDKLGDLESFTGISFNDNIFLASIISIVKNNLI